MKKQTTSTKKEILSSTPLQMHTIDASGRTLGRVASEAASHLIGKRLPSYRRGVLPINMSVIIRNAGKLRISERKKNFTKYVAYSGYAGGLKTTTLGELLPRKGITEAVSRTVSGMLPKNKLREQAMKRLSVFE